MASSKGAVKTPCNCNTTVEWVTNALTHSMVRNKCLTKPRQFQNGENAEEFVRSIESYAKTIGAKDEDKIYLLLNNLPDDLKYQIFALPDYSKQCESYVWVKKKFLDLNSDRTSPLLNLLKIKQRHLSIREFVGQLRVRAYKLMGQEDPAKREKLLLKAFYNGLNDKNLGILVKASDPQTLEEACKLIKDEPSLQSENCFTRPGVSEPLEYIDAIMKPSNFKINDDIAELKREIASLKEQIKYLISLSNSQIQKSKFVAPAINSAPKFDPKQANFSAQKCFNCNQNGHISRDCQKRCRICGAGHTSYACPKRVDNFRSNDRKVRLIADNSSNGGETSADEHDLTDDQTDIDGCNCISAIASTPTDSGEWQLVTNKRNRTRRKIPRERENSVLVNEWSDFIEGRRSRPSRPLLKVANSTTLITKRRPEKAAINQ